MYLSTKIDASLRIAILCRSGITGPISRRAGRRSRDSRCSVVARAARARRCGSPMPPRRSRTPPGGRQRRSPGARHERIRRDIISIELGFLVVTLWRERPLPTASVAGRCPLQPIRAGAVTNALPGARFFPSARLRGGATSLPDVATFGTRGCGDGRRVASHMREALRVSWFRQPARSRRMAL